MNDDLNGTFDPRARILGFAAHVGRAHAIGAEAEARLRNWLSEAGDITRDGAELLRALADQDATRTVFRGNF